MAFATSDACDRANSEQSSAARDRARILSMIDLEYQVFSAAELRTASEEGSFELGLHFPVSFSRRGAITIARQFSGPPFDLVLLDYVRFPKGLALVVLFRCLYSLFSVVFKATLRRHLA
jgi:hypothetical protein